MIAAREFTTAAEIFANAKAVRAKFFAPKPRVNLRIKDVEEEPKKRQPTIIVSYRDLSQKDAHVTAFRLYEAKRDCKAHAYLKARASELGFPVEDIIGKGRTRGIVRPRQVIVWEIKRNIKPWISFPELGRMFGFRDHTTMLHSINMIDRLIASGEMTIGEDGKIVMRQEP